MQMSYLHSHHLQCAASPYQQLMYIKYFLFFIKRLKTYYSQKILVNATVQQLTF